MNADGGIRYGRVLSGLLGALLIGQVQAADSLLSFYEQARQHVPTLAAARLLRDAALEKPVQAKAALRPSVRLQADAGRQLGASAFDPAPYQDRGVHNWSWNLLLSQVLWRPGALEAVALADLEVLRAQANFRQAELDLMLKVSQASLDWLTARREEQVGQAQVRAVEQQLTLARNHFNAGLTTTTDVHEASARLHLARAQWLQACSDVSQRSAELHGLLGAVPKDLAPLRIPEPGVEAAHVDDDVAANPTVLAHDLALQVAGREVRKQRQALGPTVDLTLGYGRNASTGSLTAAAELPVRSRSAQAGVRLSLPLYEGGVIESRVREALLLQEKAGADLMQARQQAQMMARQSREALRHGHARVEALSEALQASEAAVAATKIGYRIGTRINLDVLNAEQQLFHAERDLYRARADVLLQSLRLKAARGELSEADLAATSLPTVATDSSKEKP